MSDLPEILNGASKVEISYNGEPISHFQRQVKSRSRIPDDLSYKRVESRITEDLSYKRVDLVYRRTYLTKGMNSYIGPILQKGEIMYNGEAFLQKNWMPLPYKGVNLV